MGALAILVAIARLLGSLKLDATAVGLLALGIAYLMPRRINQIVPAWLPALVVGSLAVFFFLSGAPVLGDVPTGPPEYRLPTLTVEAVPGIV